jgi:TRAP-type C4-dicarboxylate transport system permease small subunit
MTKVLCGFVGAVRRICEICTIAAFSVLIVVTLLQVLGRLPGVPAPVFTEEVARFALVYLVAFGCGIAALRSELVNVDLFVNLLPEGGRRVAHALSLVLVIAFSAAILRGSWDYMMNGIGERARSFEMPMVWVYAAVLIIPIALIFFSAARLFGCRAPEHRAEEIE